jgi:hypothetical protein
MSKYEVDLKKYKIENIPRPYKYSTISAGSSETLFDLKLSKDQIAFVSYLGNIWFSNTYSELKFDYELYNDSTIGYEIAGIDSPHEELPPIIAHERITWKFFNGDTSSHTFECLVKGIIINKR